MINTKLVLGLAIVAIAAFGFIAATPLIIHDASADGVGNSKNFGQCKKSFPNGEGCNSAAKPGNN